MMARSRALDRLRKRPTTSATAIPEVPLLAEPSAGLQREEAGQTLRSGLAELAAEQGEPIRLAFFEGHTHEEIAAILRLPLGTVKTRIRLGMMRLRECFREENVGPGQSFRIEWIERNSPRTSWRVP